MWNAEAMNELREHGVGTESEFVPEFTETKFECRSCDTSLGV